MPFALGSNVAGDGAAEGTAAYTPPGPGPALVPFVLDLAGGGSGEGKDDAKGLLGTPEDGPRRVRRRSQSLKERARGRDPALAELAQPRSAMSSPRGSPNLSHGRSRRSGSLQLEAPPLAAESPQDVSALALREEVARLNRHGRANMQHAKLAAKSLGISLADWGTMRMSPGGCRPHSALVRPIDCEEPARLPQVLAAAFQQHSVARRRALLIAPAKGMAAVLSRYLDRAAVAHDSAPDFQRGTARVKQTNAQSKAKGRRPMPVSMVIADIEGSARAASRRVPESMLRREGIRFVLVCSQAEKGLLEQADAPWYAIAQRCAVITKPVRRMAFWAALVGESVAPDTLADSVDVAPAPKAASPAAGPRLLLVEDDEINVLAATQFLAWGGWTAAVARDGAAAVASIEAAGEPFDLILMDCMMPVLDGFQATRRIRAIEAANGQHPVPIVAMTGFDAPEERSRMHAAGMTDHIAKPFSKEELRAVVKRHLEEA